MYKDKAKQREANRQAMRRNRAKGITTNTPCVTIGGIAQGITQPVIPLNVIPKLAPEDKGQELHLCIESKPKRGLDIKSFEDLSPDVQQIITMMSRRDGKIDPIEKTNRTAIAIHYQHVVPRRFKPDCGITCRGVVVTGKPGDEDYNGI